MEILCVEGIILAVHCLKSTINLALKVPFRQSDPKVVYIKVVKQESKCVFPQHHL